MKRRQFLQSSLAAYWASSLGLSLAGLSDLALAQPKKNEAAPGKWPATNKPFILVFLRGGADTLSLLSPLDDPDFIAARPPEMRIKLEGFNTTPLLASGVGGKTPLYWHPNAQPLAKLFEAGRLAPWVAVGITDETRSHFEAQEIMERGVSSLQQLSDSYGWMARQLQQEAKSQRAKSVLPLFAGNNNLPAVLQGDDAVLAARDLSYGISFPGGPAGLRALQALCAQEASHPASSLMRITADTIDAVNQAIPKEAQTNKVIPYASAGQTPYPNSDPAVGLRSVARLIQAKVGLQYASVDHLGWDTHEYQNGKIDYLIRDLSNALLAFDEDMKAQQQPYTLVVMTEFGRRLRTNRSNGTDHGHGGVALVLGDVIEGGKVMGNWPGLGTGQLDRGVDLAVTTDYREVLKKAIAS
jgi:uncharacterized protein (DUF1501 family)